jgi:hypothetical protein
LAAFERDDLSVHVKGSWLPCRAGDEPNPRAKTLRLLQKRMVKNVALDREKASGHR